MRTGTIYKHTIKETGKSYIGQTINGFKKRLKGHINNSLRKENPKTIFHKAIRKYGKNSIISEILEENVILYSNLMTRRTNLDDLEIYYIKKYNTVKEGYNTSFGGNCPMTGRKHSKEALKLMSENNKSKEIWDKKSKEEREHFGSIMSEAKKKWISENYDKHIDNMRKNGLFNMKGEKNPFYGKKHSEKNLEKAVNNRRKNNNGEYHPNGNRTAKTFLFISPDGKEYKVFNSAKKFCEEHEINVKIFQRYPNQVIKKNKMWNSRTSQETKNSVGWKRIEL